MWGAFRKEMTQHGKITDYHKDTKECLGIT